MKSLILSRLGLMLLLAIGVTIIVFFMTNLQPSLEKLARSEGSSRMSNEDVVIWLETRGYNRSMLVKYGEWLGFMPGYSYVDGEGNEQGRCRSVATESEVVPTYCGVLQGYWGQSSAFNDDVSSIIGKRLALTGKLMFWVLVVMVPTALILGVLAGMREGSVTDRAISSASIISTSAPEYVTGVVFVAIFVSSSVGLKWFKGTATSAMENATFENFFLPVITIALYGVGYLARMTRASMAEVMTSQYIRTARLKGLPFHDVVLKHALRNALIAPFTVILLQVPWLLTGVVIVETLFNYKGFGWALVQAAGTNDIELLLGISVVSVVIVLATQLLSDVGYAILNPRIRIK